MLNVHVGGEVSVLPTPLSPLAKLREGQNEGKNKGKEEESLSEGQNEGKNKES